MFRFKNSTASIANHSAAFTWRFQDGDDVGTDGVGQLIAGVKAEALAIRASKMCLANANRKGIDGVNVAIGFHQQWLDDQRRRGSNIELIDIYVDALRFLAEKHEDLERLSLDDLQKAVMRSA